MTSSDLAGSHRGHIYVLAGVNGAGKSSVLGEAVRAAGATYYNPDEATRLILAMNPGAALDEANVTAWRRGVQDLRTAIADGRQYAFETTLGGNSAERAADLSYQPPPVLLLRAGEAAMEYAADPAPLWASPIIQAAHARRRSNPTR